MSVVSNSISTDASYMYAVGNKIKAHDNSMCAVDSLMCADGNMISADDNMISTVNRGKSTAGNYISTVGNSDLAVYDTSKLLGRFDIKAAECYLHVSKQDWLRLSTDWMNYLKRKK